MTRARARPQPVVLKNSPPDTVRLAEIPTSLNPRKYLLFPTDDHICQTFRFPGYRVPLQIASKVKRVMVMGFGQAAIWINSATKAG